MIYLNDIGAAWTKKVFHLIFLLLFFVLTPICPALAASLEKPVAKVNDTILKEIDVQEALNEIMPAGVFHGGFSSEKRASHRPKAVEKIIEKELFYQEAVKKGLEGA